MKQKIYVEEIDGKMHGIAEVTAEEAGHSRLREIFCVLFDHQWNEIRQETSGNVILWRSVRCGNCGLYRIAERGK